MQNRLLAAIALALLFISSCKKNESSSVTNNGWVINDTVYNITGTAQQYQYGNYYYALTAASSSPESNMYIVFPTRPVSSGIYHISNKVDATHMVVNVNLKSRNYLLQSTGNDNMDALVTVLNNKLRVQLPKFWIANSITKDSLQITATINEN